MDEFLVPGFGKDPSRKVVGILNTYKGQPLAHIREMIAADNEAGWRHGPGVAVPAERAGELADAVARLRDVASLDAVVAVMPVGKDQIRVGTQTFQGHNLAFVRKHYLKDGTWLPTKQGVSVRITLVDELIALAARLAEEAGGPGVGEAVPPGAADGDSPTSVAPAPGPAVEGRCEKHGLPMSQCAPCKAKTSDRPEWVFMTMGGSIRYHRVPDCEAMLDGQELVHDRGGEMAEVRKVSLLSAEMEGKTPCRKCF